jgi:hypothetical protein
MTPVAGGIDMRVDITVWDEIGWRLPPELLAEDCLESDDSAQHVSFEQIQVDALVQICKDTSHANQPGWFSQLNDCLLEYTREQEMDIDTCEDYYLTVKEWADVINETIVAHAQNQLEDRESGDYWKE